MVAELSRLSRTRRSVVGRSWADGAGAVRASRSRLAHTTLGAVARRGVGVLHPPAGIRNQVRGHRRTGWSHPLRCGCGGGCSGDVRKGSGRCHGSGGGDRMRTICLRL
ncbi:hypothetical protein GCM10018787_34190 [Streptomyces thermodiastaticus]|nr:hypothetical protein GCM10018787_34190 [Streptomyces thermodiastaticus]